MFHGPDQLSFMCSFFPFWCCLYRGEGGRREEKLHCSAKFRVVRSEDVYLGSFQLFTLKAPEEAEL